MRCAHHARTRVRKNVHGMGMEKEAKRQFLGSVELASAEHPVLIANIFSLPNPGYDSTTCRINDTV